ncbi:MAG: PilT/PilU family type 4a pilus ATPase [Dehalococcoidales bacterium]|nr:PilT/PilU family type 4a pilus ATPase [Dehalococcoidales bacterium]
MNIISLLELARASSASDLHLIAGSAPVMRIHGSLIKRDDMPVLTAEDIQQGFEQISSPEGRRQFQNNSELDFSFSVPNCGRLRCNAARQMGTTSLVIRILPEAVPQVDKLGLPEVCKELIRKPRGLIIISGPTGSGKSTTMAAMINELNKMKEGKGKRIVTIEDPVEYVYKNESCIITQRELGSDTRSFAEGLRHVLRQDPDVILIGEMRDTETASAALTIAETGHLVITTGHAPSTSGAIERIIDLFPPHERNLIQSRLASLLIGILCQTLIPRKDRSGMVPAVEVLLANSAVRNLIREGKIYQLSNVIRTNLKEGMQLLDHALVKLYKDILISRESVFAFCNDRDEIERAIGSASAKDETPRL